ncbi:MAG: T9SS type A sorting domain-containing protein [Bacteroidota bacterium]|nr:T9SS type A sorting domain-containing protein [Bacteroidota bacterium]
MKNRGILITSILFLTMSAIQGVRYQWVQTNGPYGGGMVTVFTSGTNLFASAGETKFGVYKSTDDGTSWAAVNDGLPPGTAVLTFGSIGTKLYAGTTKGIFLSTNSGTHWTTLDTTTDINDFAIIGSNLFASIDYVGVILSTNEGETWTNVSSGLPHDIPIYCLGVMGTRLFAGTASGMYMSSNNGATWTSLETSFLPSRAVSFAVSGPNLFAGTRDVGVIISTDSGESWSAVNTGLPQNASCNVLGIRDNNIFVSINGAGVFRSSDLGVNWTKVDLTGLTWAFAFLDTDSFAATAQGMFRSTDSGRIWTSCNTGILNTAVQSFGVIGSNLLAGAQMLGTYLSTDKGNSWTSVGGFTAYAFAASGSNLFAAAGGVFFSTDSGLSWKSVSTGLPSSSRVLSLAISGSIICAGTQQDSIYMSANNGASWQAIGKPGTYTSALAVHGQDLFAGTTNGVFVLTDNGTTWMPASSGLPNACNIATFVIRDKDLFVADQYAGVFHSTNNGSNWTAINVGLTDIHIYGLVGSGSNLFAGSLYNGVFLSTDNGANWTPENTGLAINNVFALAATGTDLFVGTYGSGVWRRPLSEMAGGNSVQQPIEASYVRVYPNPLSASTTITFSLLDHGFARVDVVNLIDTKVQQLYSGELEAGEHSFTWDAREMPDGIYFARVHTGGKVQSGQMLVAH